MDGFAWTVVGSVAGVAGTVAVVFGVVPVLAGRRQRREQAGAELAAGRRLGGLLPAPVLGVEVRGRAGIDGDALARVLRDRAGGS